MKRGMAMPALMGLIVAVIVLVLVLIIALSSLGPAGLLGFAKLLPDFLYDDSFEISGLAVVGYNFQTGLLMHYDGVDWELINQGEDGLSELSGYVFSPSELTDALLAFYFDTPRKPPASAFSVTSETYREWKPTTIMREESRDFIIPETPGGLTYPYHWLVIHDTVREGFVGQGIEAYILGYDNVLRDIVGGGQVIRDKAFIARHAQEIESFIAWRDQILSNGEAEAFVEARVNEVLQEYRVDVVGPYLFIDLDSPATGDVARYDSYEISESAVGVVGDGTFPVRVDVRFNSFDRSTDQLVRIVQSAVETVGLRDQNIVDVHYVWSIKDGRAAWRLESLEESGISSALAAHECGDDFYCGLEDIILLYEEVEGRDLSISVQHGDNPLERDEITLSLAEGVSLENVLDVVTLSYNTQLEIFFSMADEGDETEILELSSYSFVATTPFVTDVLYETADIGMYFKLDSFADETIIYARRDGGLSAIPIGEVIQIGEQTIITFNPLIISDPEKHALSETVIAHATFLDGLFYDSKTNDIAEVNNA